MTKLKPVPLLDEEHDRGRHAPIDQREIARPPGLRDEPRRHTGRRIFGAGVMALLIGTLAFGFWRHYSVHAQVMATAEQRRDFVPNVRVAQVRSSGSSLSVTLPGSTEAFEAANLYARASGYIAKRYVDIGDHVKAGDLLAEISAPELDHQITQAQATLAQNEAALRQAQANLELAKVTWTRDSKLVDQGWVTKQQGDTDRLNLEAQQAAVAVAQANIQAQQARLLVLDQQKAYQRVVAPFDGVVTQRNIDAGSLVQADAASGTFLFAMMHSDVIRIQLYVPQDQAFGFHAGVDAVVRVPEMPGVSFPGKVSRVADALQPGTRTLLTEIDVPNRDGALTPGTYCLVELQIPRKTPSLIVPSEALIFNRDGMHVAVVENDVVHIRKITLVRDLGTAVEASDGVKDGDLVVLNPPVDFEDGQAVKPRTVPGHKIS